MSVKSTLPHYRPSDKLVAKHLARYLILGYDERSKSLGLWRRLRLTLRVRFLLPLRYVLPRLWTKRGRNEIRNPCSLNHQCPPFFQELILALRAIYQERQLESGQKPLHSLVYPFESPLESSIGVRDNVSQSKQRSTVIKGVRKHARRNYPAPLNE